MIRTVLPMLAVLGLACSSGEPAVAPAASSAPPQVGEPFIAMNRDLRDFRSWARWRIPDIGVRTGHDVGDPRFVYVNRAPTDTYGALPIGTIVVKTLERGAFAEWEVHAMVKRGGGYNTGGADGWEWMDLRLSDAGAAAITWRGEGTAEDSGSYGPDVDRGGEIGCNSCHQMMRASDQIFVRGFLVSEEPERRGK